MQISLSKVGMAGLGARANYTDVKYILIDFYPLYWVW
jgi:hypothetical protein